MADKLGTRLDSLSRRTATPAAAAKGLKFKPKTVARRTKEERDADAPAARPDAAPKHTPHKRGGAAGGAARGGMRGGMRGLQGTHLVQAGPLASGSALNETSQNSRRPGGGGVSGSSGARSTSSTPGYLSHLLKSEAPDASRESTPGLDSDDEDDLARINMSKEYRFSVEESELFPVRAPRAEHASDKVVMETTREQSAVSNSDVEMLDNDNDNTGVKEEPGVDTLSSVLKQRDDELHKKLNKLELKTVAIAEDAVDDVENSEKLLNDHRTLVKEILDIDNRDDKYLLFQLPRLLPEFVNPHKDSTVKDEDEDEDKDKDKATTTTNDEPETLLPDKKPKLEQEGQVGKLRVHRSGKVTMKIGNVVMDVSRGSQTGFLQEVLLVDTKQNQGYLVGHLEDKVVVTPSFQ
jgi:DNA-directed RNA polymerase III subunit RPC4